MAPIPTHFPLAELSYCLQVGNCFLFFLFFIFCSCPSSCSAFQQAWRFPSCVWKSRVWARSSKCARLIWLPTLFCGKSAWSAQSTWVRPPKRDGHDDPFQEVPFVRWNPAFVLFLCVCILKMEKTRRFTSSPLWITPRTICSRWSTLR